VDQHFIVADTDIERVEVLDSEVVRVVGVEGGPVEPFDGDFVAVGGEEVVAGVKLLAFLPLSI
jgi:hypothetical protein